MRFVLCALMLAAALPAAISTTAQAAKTSAKTGDKNKVAALLVSSTPANNATGQDAVNTVSMHFNEKVELYSVVIYRPDGNEIAVFQTSYDKMNPPKKGRSFNFKLDNPLREPGAYKISYLLATRTHKSINGFIDFNIEPTGSAPAF